MTYSWSAASLLNLKGVHPDLRKVADLALKYTTVDFRVVDGVRTLAEQKRYLKQGRTTTLNSMHLVRKDGYGHAIDFVALTRGQPDWFHIANFVVIGAAFKRASKELGIPIVWGGDWKTFKDYGHIELDRKRYPG
jgi:peptidoglycan L-alanyl-D-glutamate endopeptidase CwlK